MNVVLFEQPLHFPGLERAHEVNGEDDERPDGDGQQRANRARRPRQDLDLQRLADALRHPDLLLDVFVDRLVLQQRRRLADDAKAPRRKDVFEPEKTQIN